MGESALIKRREDRINIDDFMEGLGPTPELSLASCQQLVDSRMATFQAFAVIEADKGFVSYPWDLRTPKGQDISRLLFWRCVEEYAEAISATSTEHVLEELIDSFNYISAALWAVDPNIAAEGLLAVLNSIKNFRQDPTGHRLGEIAYRLSNATELFRNRAWMHNAQSTYFDGMHIYCNAIFAVMIQIIEGFKDWDEFWRYFMAKDAVLQFRLHSHY